MDILDDVIIGGFADGSIHERGLARTRTRFFIASRLGELVVDLLTERSELADLADLLPCATGVT